MAISSDSASTDILASTLPMPGEEDGAPDDTEPTPPGEHKREPINDPDPVDTKLHVHERQS